MRDDMKILYDPYISYNQLLETLSRRKNNSVMKDDHSSNRKDYNWFGTHSYSEAEEMMIKGYTSVVDKMHKNVVEQTKINSKFYADVNHAIPHNDIRGYIPNVPNAIRNIPQSMINIDKKPMKRKTISIIYGVSGNCQKSRDFFEKPGVALLSAVDIIERCGIQTKIELGFGMTYSSNEFAFPTVMIKNYGERFSIQKVSFPLVHTSMFRRIGFKWLETTPMISVHGFAGGYGMAPDFDMASEAVQKILKGKGIYIDNDWIYRNDNSVEAILKKLEVI